MSVCVYINKLDVFCITEIEGVAAPEEEVKSLEEIYRERALLSLMEAKRKKSKTLPMIQHKFPIHFWLACCCCFVVFF